jgi:tetratricopeptide (TPR) repeat protein
MTTPIDDRLRQLIALGREHYRANEYDKAEGYLSRAVKQHQGFADVYNMLGVIYHSNNRFAEAEEAFEQALRINPNYTEAALNLSVTYNDRGKYQQAREVYAVALQSSYQAPRSLDPFARGKIANMHAELGAVYAGVGLYHESVREFLKALDLCPSFIDIRTRLGHVYRDMGSHDAAIVAYEDVKREKPDYLPARVALGVTLFSIGRKAEAVREWEAVLSIDANEKQAAAYLRMVEDNAGPQPGSALRDPGEQDQ